MSTLKVSLPRRDCKSFQGPLKMKKLQLLYNSKQTDNFVECLEVSSRFCFESIVHYFFFHDQTETICILQMFHQLVHQPFPWSYFALDHYRSLCLSFHGHHVHLPPPKKKTQQHRSTSPKRLGIRKQGLIQSANAPIFEIDLDLRIVRWILEKWYEHVYTWCFQIWYPWGNNQFWLAQMFQHGWRNTDWLVMYLTTEKAANSSPWMPYCQL